MNVKKCYGSIALILIGVSLPVFSLVSKTPQLSTAVKQSSEGFSLFLSLWEFSLKVDKGKDNPVSRDRIEPKTLLLPGDYAMAHLVPQDGFHPLYMDDAEHFQLRREFLLDHLILNELPTNDPASGSSLEGLREVTLSGKPVHFRREDNGDLTVAGVRVKKTVSLPDGSKILVLSRPLFNQTQKVREAFDKLHQITKDEATGPPLDIPGPPGAIQSHPIIRAPAPPPPQIARPPAPPSELEKKLFEEKQAKPPAPPGHNF